MRKGCTLQVVVVHEPLATGPSRADVGCDGARRPEVAPGCRPLTQGRHSTLDVRLRDVAQVSEMALRQQVVLEQTQGHLVPLHGFWTSVVASLILEVVLDGSLDGHG